MLRRSLPKEAILLAHNPQTIFRFWGGQAEERLRPDIRLIPVPLTNYPGMVEDLAGRSPVLRDVLRGILLSGRARIAEVRALAARQTVLVELDPHVDRALYPYLLPAGAYYQVMPITPAERDRDAAAQRQGQMWSRILQRLGPLEDTETRAQVFWRRFHDGVYFASVGDRSSARAAVDDALAINDQDEDLRRLALALQRPNADGVLEGPVDLEGVADFGVPNSP